MCNITTHNIRDYAREQIWKQNQCYVIEKQVIGVCVICADMEQKQ